MSSCGTAIPMRGPMGVGTFGSRSLAIGGSAIARASEGVREKAVKIAAHMLEAAPGDIEFADGQYRVKGVPSRSLGLGEIAARAYSEDLPDDIDTGLEATDFFRPGRFHLSLRQSYRGGGDRKGHRCHQPARILFRG